MSVKEEIFGKLYAVGAMILLLLAATNNHSSSITDVFVMRTMNKIWTFNPYPPLPQGHSLWFYRSQRDDPSGYHPTIEAEQLGCLPRSSLFIFCKNYTFTRAFLFNTFGVLLCFPVSILWHTISHSGSSLANHLTTYGPYRIPTSGSANIHGSAAKLKRGSAPGRNIFLAE